MVNREEFPTWPGRGVYLAGPGHSSPDSVHLLFFLARMTLPAAPLARPLFIPHVVAPPDRPSYSVFSPYLGPFLSRVIFCGPLSRSLLISVPLILPLITEIPSCPGKFTVDGREKRKGSGILLRNFSRGWQFSLSTTSSPCQGRLIFDGLQQPYLPAESCPFYLQTLPFQPG